MIHCLTNICWMNKSRRIAAMKVNDCCSSRNNYLPSLSPVPALLNTSICNLFPGLFEKSCLKYIWKAIWCVKCTHFMTGGLSVCWGFVAENPQMEFQHIWIQMSWLSDNRIGSLTTSKLTCLPFLGIVTKSNLHITESGECLFFTSMESRVTNTTTET